MKKSVSNPPTSSSASRRSSRTAPTRNAWPGLRGRRVSERSRPGVVLLTAGAPSHQREGRPTSDACDPPSRPTRLGPTTPARWSVLGTGHESFDRVVVTWPRVRVHQQDVACRRLLEAMVGGRSEAKVYRELEQTSLAEAGPHEPSAAVRRRVVDHDHLVPVAGYGAKTTVEILPRVVRHDYQRELRHQHHSPRSSAISRVVAEAPPPALPAPLRPAARRATRGTNDGRSRRATRRTPRRGADLSPSP